ncbi:MAG: PDZ domain-containing protein [Pyrinomonadaceae bacterium]
MHRLNGLKMFRLLLRSSEEIGAITRLDDAFRMTEEVHTNVIAGLSLADGQTIAAWLPDAEAEMGPPPAPYAPAAPSANVAAPRATTQAPRIPTPSAVPGASLYGEALNLFERPDVTVIGRDGRRLVARYVGLDGVTGLSILKLATGGLVRAVDAKEGAVAVGERLRLFGPEPVTQPEVRTSGTIYARMGETEGTVVEITRAPSGAIARVKIRSAKLSAANIGGIAINDAGETVGIVDVVESNEASVLPATLIRNAARRVLARQASVPKPWLGIRGEPVTALTIDELLLRGWQKEGAMSLAEASRGIMLTSVTPGSPAAVAALNPGDVILRVNEEEIRNADDFSWLLEEAGPGGSVNFVVARPGKLAPEAVKLTLSELPHPLFGLRRPFAEPPRPTTRVEPLLKPGAFSGSLSRSLLSSSLIAEGIETIALKPRVAARFGASGGLLVVYVQPSTAAFKAGLRSGDLIEAINGQQISLAQQSVSLLNAPGASYAFKIVRNKEKLVVKVVMSPN